MSLKVGTICSVVNRVDISVRDPGIAGLPSHYTPRAAFLTFPRQVAPIECYFQIPCITVIKSVLSVEALSYGAGDGQDQQIVPQILRIGVAGVVPQ